MHSKKSTAKSSVRKRKALKGDGKKVDYTDIHSVRKFMLETIA